MTEHQEQAGSVEPEEGHEPSRTVRRGLLAGAAAAAAVAVALDRGGRADAANGDPVLLGQANEASLPTSIVNAGGPSAVALRATCMTGFGGSGLEGTGSAYGVVGHGGFFAGVFGRNTTTVGVRGYSLGNTTQSIGVSGSSESDQGVGVFGQCHSSVGVIGRADGNDVRPTMPVGVYGAATVENGIGGAFGGTRAALRLEPTATSGAPAEGAHEVGEVVVDSAGRVFVCTTAGTPGLWNELGASAPDAPPAALRPTLQLLPTPERFVDTRRALGGVQGVVPAGTTNTFSLTGRDGQALNAALQIPDAATAIVGNLTVIGAPGTPGAYLTMWPSGDMPTVSNINYGPNNVGDAIANSFTVGLGDIGDGHRGVKLFNFGQCDYIIDVTGYYVLA